MLRNILAVLAGLVVGGIVNMGIVMISGSIIAPPEGVDVASVESMAESMHLYQPKHYILPFLAHALGTLVGAFVAVKIAVSHHIRIALVVGAFFLLGGIMMAFQLPAPIWFEALDIIVAYIPMAYLGHSIGGGSKSSS